MIRTYLDRATWAEIYLINGIGGAAIVVAAWLALVWMDWEFHNWVGGLQ